MATSVTNLTKSKDYVHASDKDFGIGPFKSKKKRFADEKKHKNQRILPNLFVDDSKINPR